jgi:hypothetical protein
MKTQRVLTEKPVNAKIVFRGVVVEIKKVSDQEVELTFPENVDAKELLSYLESFGVLKRKVVTPHAEPQLEAQPEESAPVQQEAQVKEDTTENSEEEDKKENSTELETTNTENTNTEEPPKAKNTTTKRRTRKSNSN